mgnify:CR=1 FL=1
MKKVFTALMLAAMVLSTGCGNQAQDAAKDAQQKVEQKVEQSANAVKEETQKVEEKTEQKIQETAQQAQETKQELETKVEETKDASVQATEDALKKADEMKSDIANRAEEITSIMNERVVALGGLMPGVSVDEVKSMFGEPTSTEGNVVTFANGLKVVLDGAQNVKSISTIVDAFDTPEGVYVGASEYSLNDYCGPADAVRVANNIAEYEYNSGDKKSVVIYKAQNGIISEITCSLK